MDKETSLILIKKNVVIKMTINKQKHKFEVILEKVLSCPPTSNAELPCYVTAGTLHDHTCGA
jgi:hypothetical protein